MKIAFDQALLERKGVVFMQSHGQRASGLQFMDPDLALDAQPTLATAANAGIPFLFTTYVDPKLIEVLYTPMKAAEVYGEMKTGDWVTDTVMFEVVESTGETSAYGDYSNNGSSGANLNYPQRQSFHYQTFSQWGERELERQAKAKVDWANRINIASALVLNKYQNLTYLYGVQGLQCYGAINEPTLPAPIAVTQTWSTAQPNQIYGDVQRLVSQLIAQSGQILDTESEFILILSPSDSVWLTSTNTYGINVHDLIKKNYPKMTIKTIPEFATAGAAGVNLVQLIAPNVEGQKTSTCAFTEKMRAHAIVTEPSAWKQKKSQGTWGYILFRSFLIAQMIG